MSDAESLILFGLVCILIFIGWIATEGKSE
jgi:hypothetical protein